MLLTAKELHVFRAMLRAIGEGLRHRAEAPKELPGQLSSLVDKAEAHEKADER